MKVPVLVVARNEERAIEASLVALRRSLARAEERLGLRFELLVALDDCTDGTRALCEKLGVAFLESSGGKVEAQRRGWRAGPFQIFSDADVLAGEEAVALLCETMLQTDALVAAPALDPLAPRRRTPLAWALHLYNARRGFASRQRWFNGRLFALRGLALPSRAELSERARGLPASRFHDFAGDLVADDLWLSRLAALRSSGAIVRCERAVVRYRAPETLRGMYRYYRRLRRELARTDALFPESRREHRRADRLAGAPLREKLAFAIFSLALVACQGAYLVERALIEMGALEPRIWPPVEETKSL